MAEEEAAWTAAADVEDIVAACWSFALLEVDGGDRSESLFIGVEPEVPMTEPLTE